MSQPYVQYFLNSKLPAPNPYYVIGAGDIVTRIDLPHEFANDQYLADILGYAFVNERATFEAAKTPAKKTKQPKKKVAKAEKPKKIKSPKPDKSPKKEDISIFEETPFTKQDVIRNLGNTDRRGFVKFVHE